MAITFIVTEFQLITVIYFLTLRCQTKKLRIMTRNELLNEFLAGEPESLHQRDRNRFVAYAVRCAKWNVYIDTKAMRKHGLSEEFISELEIAFEWIRDTTDYLLNR